MRSAFRGRGTRSTVTTVTVSPTTDTLAPAATAQLAATVKDQNGATMTGQSVSWSSNATGVATVSSSGLVTAVATGTATITATSSGKSGTATIVVTSGTSNNPPPPPPTGIWRANEPAGMSQLLDSPFNTVATTNGGTAEGWTLWYAGSLSKTSDSTAPVSSPSVGQFLFPTSQAYGSGAGTLAYIPPAGYTKLYISFAVKLSSNYFGPGHQKLFYVYAGGASPLPAAVVEYAVPQNTTGPIYPFVETENSGNDGNYWSSNQSDVAPRGSWHIYEVYMSLNDPGVANGVLKFWVDGKEYDNPGASLNPTQFQLIPGGGTKQFGEIDFSPTYGGGGTPMSPPAAQYIYLDHVYISASK